jgi:hypothetical protein
MAPKDRRVQFDDGDLAAHGLRQTAVPTVRAMIDWLPLSDIEAGSPGLPDTPAARAAYALAAELSEPFLLNHEVRSWCWANQLGRAHGVSFDAEGVFVAAVLHDIGLTDRYIGTGCFEEVGGETATQFLRGLGWPLERAATVGRSIVKHVELSVPLEDGAEAHVVDIGVSCDITGRRLEEIEPEIRTKVLETWPRLDFKRRMTALLRHDAELEPDCATARWFDELDLAGRIAGAPYDG